MACASIRPFCAPPRSGTPNLFRSRSLLFFRCMGWVSDGLSSRCPTRGDPLDESRVHGALSSRTRSRLHLFARSCVQWQSFESICLVILSRIGSMMPFRHTWQISHRHKQGGQGPNHDESTSESLKRLDVRPRCACTHGKPQVYEPGHDNEFQCEDGTYCPEVNESCCVERGSLRMRRLPVIHVQCGRRAFICISSVSIVCVGVGVGFMCGCVSASVPSACIALVLSSVSRPPASSVAVGALSGLRIILLVEQHRPRHFSQTTLPRSPTPSVR